MQPLSPLNTQSIEVLEPRAVAAMLGHISLTTIWRMRRRGDFPEPLQLSPGRKGWRRSDIEDWLSKRVVAGRVA